jgi:hypothetical protein
MPIPNLRYHWTDANLSHWFSLRHHNDRRANWAKLRRAQCEKMFSELPLEADIAQYSLHVSKVPTGDIALAFLSTEEIATEMALSKSPGQCRGLEDFDFLLSIRRLRETSSSSFEDSCVLRKRLTP